MPEYRTYPRPTSHWDGHQSDDSGWSDTEKLQRQRVTDSPASPASLRPSIHLRLRERESPQQYRYTTSNHRDASPGFHHPPPATSVTTTMSYESDAEEQVTTHMSKSELRKYKNRLSAKRSRMRSRGRLEELEQHVKELNAANHRLQKTVEILLAERARGWPPVAQDATVRHLVEARWQRHQPYARPSTISHRYHPSAYM